MEDIAGLLKEWTPNPGVSKEVVDRVQSELGIVFPRDYIELMEWFNGGEDWIGESYLRLWPMEEIPWNNENLGATKFASGLIFFGGDVGGMLYGFDTHFDPPAIIEVDAVCIGIEEDTKTYHMIFTEFLQLLYNRKYPEIYPESEL